MDLRLRGLSIENGLVSEQHFVVRVIMNLVALEKVPKG